MSKQKLYCYCNYGESGTMVGCENCDGWFHDECLGLSEAEILNIIEFYCIECLNKNSNLSIKYKTLPPALSFDHKNTFCYCHGGEGGLMVECGKCRNWFHDECIDKTESEIKQILIYFCPCCLTKDNSLKIVYKDYSKEHTKFLFNSHHIITIYNLYPYHLLLELYKILKFRTPYCMYEIVCNLNSNNSRGLSLSIPKVLLSSQKRTFTYKAIILWNKLHKKLLCPFTVKLHSSHKIKFDSIDTVLSYYDFSTKVSAFKSKLRDLLIDTQRLGIDDSWSVINNVV